MAAFIGKWKQDEFDHEKLRDFIKASGKQIYFFYFYLIFPFGVSDIALVSLV